MDGRSSLLLSLCLQWSCDGGKMHFIPLTLGNVEKQTQVKTLVSSVSFKSLDLSWCDGCDEGALVLTWFTSKCVWWSLRQFGLLVFPQLFSHLCRLLFFLLSFRYTPEDVFTSFPPDFLLFFPVQPSWHNITHQTFFPSDKLSPCLGTHHHHFSSWTTSLFLLPLNSPSLAQ